MKKFIELVGQENYDKLMENGRMLEGRISSQLPLPDLVPVVKLIFPHKRMALGRFLGSYEFALLTALRHQGEEEGLVYGLHTFGSGLPEISGFLVSDILNFQGVHNCKLERDEQFKPETTMMGYVLSYATKGVFWDILPCKEWHQINTLEKRQEYHQKKLRIIDEAIKNPVIIK